MILGKIKTLFTLLLLITTTTAVMAGNLKYRDKPSIVQSNID